MIFKAVSITILTLLIALPVKGSNSDYTMADLEALEAEKNVREYFKHAKDIRPSKRQETWKKMTLSMADQYAKELLANKNISHELFSKFVLISTWPVLSEDEFFAQKRNKVALAYFSQCFQTNGNDCVKRMEKVYLNFGQDPVLGFELAKIASKLKGEKMSLWGFLFPIASSPFGEFYCNKSPLYEELAALGPDIKTLTHKDCIKSFASRAKKDIKNSNMVLKTQAYRSLSLLGLLNPEEQNKQSIYDALAGALEEKKHWSRALEALSFYSESKQSRESLIEELQKHQTLPDRLFSKNASKQAMALTKLIGKKFPELLDLYANKCLSWLKGNGIFPKGNPTPNCHSYFEMAKVVGSSPEGVIKEYEQIINEWKK